jgi:copper(I)-binding protein
MKIAPYNALGCVLLAAISLLCASLVAAAEKSQLENASQRQLTTAVTAHNAAVIVPLGQGRDTQLIFTLNNSSSKSLRLISIKSAQVEAIQWVPHAGANTWNISPGQQLVLDGKKSYIQLRGLQQAISSGDELLFDIGFSDGSSMLLVAKARSAYDQIHGH